MLFKPGGVHLGSSHREVKFCRDLVLATLILRIQFKEEISAKEPRKEWLIEIGEIPGK